MGCIVLFVDYCLGVVCLMIMLYSVCVVGDSCVFWWVMSMSVCDIDGLMSLIVWIIGYVFFWIVSFGMMVVLSFFVMSLSVVELCCIL